MGNFPKKTELCLFLSIPIGWFLAPYVIYYRIGGQKAPRVPGMMYKRIRDPPRDVRCVIVGEAAEVTRHKTACL